MKAISVSLRESRILRTMMGEGLETGSRQSKHILDRLRSPEIRASSSDPHEVDQEAWEIRWRG